MRKTMAGSIIIDNDLEKLINTSAPWNLFLSDEIDSSESSKTGGEDIFDDTYSDIENIDNETENSFMNEDNKHSYDVDTEIINYIDPKIQESLVKRVESLKETICNLKELLNEEHRLWKQERKEYDSIHEKIKVNALEEVTVAAREASEAYVIESMKGIFPSTLSHNQSPTSSRRQNNTSRVSRKVLNNDYYQKLSQVERLCNEELLKIRSDADLLKPLKQMVSEWDIPAEDSTKINKKQENNTENICKD